MRKTTVGPASQASELSGIAQNGLPLLGVAFELGAKLLPEGTAVATFPSSAGDAAWTWSPKSGRSPIGSAAARAASAKEIRRRALIGRISRMTAIAQPR